MAHPVSTHLPAVRVLRPAESGWPDRLNRLASPPAQLFVGGELPAGRAVAVVGARKADAYGLQFARSLGGQLAERGLVVVSGGALGVDGAAHAGALAASGPTVAVLGCGVDVRYPRRHAALLDEIAQRGALVSELPLGAPPLEWHFPLRNRIIAALAEVVVVVRAAERSGSLITAEEAAKLGVPVLAVPGPAGDPLSRGTNALLRAGARICESAEDVVAALAAREAGGPKEPARFARKDLQRTLDDVPCAVAPSEARGLSGEARGLSDESLGPADARLLELLGAVPMPADVLGREASLGAAEASAALTRLELSGLAVRSSGNLFHRQRGI